MAPLCKGSSREAGEGLTLKRRKTTAFCRFSVPQAPFVTLMRATSSQKGNGHRGCAATEEKSADFEF